MRFEWDDKKRKGNLAKHGLDFSGIASFDWENAVVIADERFDYGEIRYRAWGSYKGRMHTIVFTLRADKIRIVSFRRANKREIERHG